VTVPTDDGDDLLAHRRSTAVTVTAWLVVAGLTLAVALPVLVLVFR